MFCPKCGNKVTDGAAWCSKCGEKLIDNATMPKEIKAPDKQAEAVVENVPKVSPNAVKAEKSQKSAKHNRVIVAIASIFAGIALVVAIIFMLGSGGNDKYVQMVKNGTFEAYPQKTVGDAFDDYLGNAKWESGKSEDGIRFVNVTGEILYYGEETDILVQFIIDDEEAGSFSYYACELNGVPQNDFFVWGLLEAIYDGDFISEGSSDDNMQDYVLGENSIIIGDTRTISTYDGQEMEVTLDSIEFTDGPLSNYHTLDDGFVYLVATLTVKNTGTKQTGLATEGSTVIYDGKYEFKDEWIVDSNSIRNLAPLSEPKTGYVVFEVPKSVEESEGALVINLSTGSEKDNLSYVIRSGDGMQSGMETWNASNEQAMSNFDAVAYLKATLDNSYKNDSRDLVKLKFATAEEAAEIYKQGIDSEISDFIAGINVSEELEQEFREVFEGIFANVKYTVDKAEKQSDGSYVVTITYEQMQIFEPMMEDYLSEIANLASDPATAALSDAELDELVFRTMKDSLQKSLDSITYAEPAELTVTIEIVNKVYTPRTSDLQNLEMSLFDMDSVSF